ncbi:MAG TPA: glycosyltransferase [Vicinamibacterales bacterium]|nr:glycosyltransferase [Vicinamibacterales bacterium]
MRILWLKSDLLLPLDKGGKLRTWHLMRQLAKHHAITFLSYADPDQPSDDIEGMGEVASEVVTIPRRDPAKGTMAFYLDAARHLVSRRPYAVAKYESAEYRQALREALSRTAFDLIVCDFLPPAVNMPAQLPCPVVLFTHNVEAEIWRRHASTASSWPKRLLYGAQHRRMLRFEAETLRRFEGVLAVSEADRETFGRLYPGAAAQPIHVVPTGVDTTFFAPDSAAPDAASPAASRSIVFTGSMDWLPNEDAMLFFCRDILPLIRAEEPDVTLSIVGRAPTSAVRRLASEAGVEVTGRVDDVRPHMRNAAAYVVPLRIGGGTRLKIFEAMAMGKAVVSTTVGAEGLPVVGGEHLLLADEPRSFARGVVRLLRDLDKRRGVEQAARQLVVANYDWSVVAGNLEEALVRFAATPVSTAPGRPVASRAPLRLEPRPLKPDVSRTPGVRT